MTDYCYEYYEALQMPISRLRGFAVCSYGWALMSVFVAVITSSQKRELKKS
jgi:hypothetical protein